MIVNYAVEDADVPMTFTVTDGLGVNFGLGPA